MILKKIGALSLAKVSGIIYAFLGLIIGVFVAIAVSLGVMAGSLFSGFSNGPSPILGFVFGIGALIICPILYGILGFLAGLIAAALYNWIVRYAGGIELELE